MKFIKEFLSNPKAQGADVEQVVPKWKDCISAMTKLKEQNDVQQIIKDLEKAYDFALPKNRRQRRTLAAQGKNHVSEAYSPPRMIKMAKKLGLKPGFAYDLTQVDEDDGEPWDLSRPDKQAKVKRKLKTDEPMMLIMSPMCGPFSQLQSLFNYPKMKKADVKAKLLDAMAHVKFCSELCLEQYVNGRLFIFEHPAGAASWGMEAMQQMKLLDGVRTIKFDFCMLGMQTHDEHGNVSAALKPTTIMTNSQAVATLLLEAQCRGEHSHTQLLGGRAKACQEYPDKFCELICQGIKRELDTIRWRDHMNKCFDISKTFHKLLSVQQKLDDLPEELATVPEENVLHELYQDAQFLDDVTGQELDKEDAIEARIKELKFFRKLGVYT